MSEGKLKNCHVEEGRSPDVNISAYSHPSFSLENVKGSSNYKVIKSGRSLDLAYQLGAMTRRDYHVASLLTITTFLFSFNAQATCTPTPDCDAIGYTETSCEGDFVKCPFDTSKLFCVPCDSSFKYDCSGDNIVSGTGSACGGKYANCECSSTDYIFSNGSCICDTSCKVGAIYYSDKTCSSCVDTNKTAIGIVVKDNELVMSAIKRMTWASNISTNTSLIDITEEVAKTDLNGINNTKTITSEYPSDTVDNNAAIYCNSYSTDTTTAGDWYLPAIGELYKYVYNNYSILNSVVATMGWTHFDGYSFWSSSEFNNYNAWYLISNDGYIYTSRKTTSLSVTCFLEIN